MVVSEVDLNPHFHLEHSYNYLTLNSGVRSGIQIRTSISCVLMCYVYLTLKLWWSQKWDFNPHLLLECSYIYLTLYGGVRSWIPIYNSPEPGAFLCLPDLIWWCQKWDSNSYLHLEVLISTWPYMVVSDVGFENIHPLGVFLYTSIWLVTEVSGVGFNTSLLEC